MPVAPPIENPRILRTSQAAAKTARSTSNNAIVTWPIPPAPVEDSDAATVGDAKGRAGGALSASSVNGDAASVMAKIVQGNLLTDLLQLSDAFSRTDNVSEANAEFLVNDNHFTMCDQCSINEYVQGLSSGSFQFDNRTLA